MEWVQELVENIDDLLASDKSINFNTHKNRKRISSTIAGLIKTAIHKNIKPEPQELPRATRYNEGTITRPNPNGQQAGFAVMTPSESEKNDEVHKNMKHGDPYNKDKISQHNTGMRRW